LKNGNIIKPRPINKKRRYHFWSAFFISTINI